MAVETVANWVMAPGTPRGTSGPSWGTDRMTTGQVKNKQNAARCDQPTRVGLGLQVFTRHTVILKSVMDICKFLFMVGFRKFF